jgi:hypothetical protein
MMRVVKKNYTGTIDRREKGEVTESWRRLQNEELRSYLHQILTRTRLTENALSALNFSKCEMFGWTDSED